MAPSAANTAGAQAASGAAGGGSAGPNPAVPAGAAAAAAAAAPAWRQFTFFDVSTVRDANDFARSPIAFRRKSTNEIAAIATSIVRPPGLSGGAESHQQQGASGSAPRANAPCVLLADIGGTVTLLDPLNAYAEIASFDAFGPAGRITHLSTDAHGRILTLGEIDSVRFPLLRIWDIRTPPTILPPRIDIADASQNKTSASSVTDPPPPPQIRWRPRLLGEARVQHGTRPLPVAAMSHTPSLSYLAIALADGTVLLMRNVDSALLGAGGTSASVGNAAPSSASQAASSASPVPAVTLPKFKVVCSPDTSQADKSAAAASSMSMSLDPVTALGFSESGSQTIAPAGIELGSAAGQADLRSGPEPRRKGRRGRGGSRMGALQSRPALPSAADPPPRVITGPTTVHLFITTLSRTLRYTVLGAGAGASPAIVDDVGCALGCAALVAPPSIPVTSTGGSWLGGGANLASSTLLGGSVAGGHSSGAKMVLARDEAVYVVGAEGREAAYANEGPKSFVRLHPSSQQLIIVSPPFAPTAASHSATVRHYVAQRDRGSPLSSSPVVGSPPSRTDSPAGFKRAGAGHHASNQPTEIAKVTVFDLDNRFVAYTGTFEGGIRDVWIEPYASPSAFSAAGTGSNAPPVGKVLQARGSGAGASSSAAADEAATGLMSLGGDIVILGDDGSLTRLTEKPLRDKLGILFRKYLFLLAVGLSKTHAARASASAYSRALASYSQHAGSSSLPKGVDRTSAAVAVALAAAQEVAARIEPLLGDIYRRYGDHLYDKGDFYGSVAQYVKTVGWVQPSYIIRKFLDAQRIQHLTTYLEALHGGGLANSDHTTLLLNCYTKLKDVKSLDRFIKHPPNLHRSDDDDEDVDANASPMQNGGAATADDLPFDLDTAIRVCRQAGYFEHAAYLAERYEQHDEYLRIQIEDGKGYGEALDYLRRLDAEEAERHLARYARILLSELPERTTDLLIEICSGTFRKAAKVDMDSAANGAGKENRPTATGYLSLLQYGKTGGTTSSNGRNQSIASMDTNVVKSGAASAITIEPTTVDFGDDNFFGEAPPYLLPSPRPFFAHFIQHQRQFIRFLETVALRRWGQSVTLDLASMDPDKAAAVRDLRERQRERIAAGLDEDDPDTKDQRAVWNTLLELYLSSAARRAGGVDLSAQGSSNGSSSSSSMTIKALAVLKQYEYLPYDNTQAVLLCSMHEFIEGLFFLYERMGMYEDILRYWMDLEARSLQSGGGRPSDDPAAGAANGRRNHVMDCLGTYGGAHPHLYPLVLRWLVSDERVLARHREDFASVLEHIEQEDLMGPLEVVKALSKSSVANLGLVREYLLRAITQEREDIDADRRLTESYRDETAKKLAELNELSDPSTAHVFQTTKCSACGGQLDLPTVHFLCKHSYHQRCLGDAETECPSCARAYGVIRDIRRNNAAFADRHDIFMAEVEDANDGFGAVANMFSKGLFGANLAGAQ